LIKPLRRALTALGLTVAAAALAAPVRSTSGEGGLASMVASMLRKHHYERVVFDDASAERWFDLYLDALDYNRNILLQSDVAEFQQYRHQFDDFVNRERADLGPALAMHERYRERMRERIAAAQEVLAGAVDLTDSESWVPDRHDAKLDWPATEAEANDLWRKGIEEAMIVAQLAWDPQDAADPETADPVQRERERLIGRYDRILKSLDDAESADVLEMWLGAMARAYDPHTAWLRPAANDNFDIQITKSVTGIGAELGTEGDYTVVKRIIPGGPASESPLAPEDKIVAVQQGSGEATDLVGMRLDKVVSFIRGEVGTEVRLHIHHPDGEREVMTMTRKVVSVGRATEGRIEERGDRKYGVVELPSFYVDPQNKADGKRASQDVKHALHDLRDQGAEGVVLDLRGNGGGSLIEAIDVAGLFISSGPVVQVRSRNGRIEALFDSDPQVHWLGPMVVLTDPTSASASEIVAGALQDYGRAVVVGSDSTHGKGTVQTLAGLPGAEGGALKLTIQKFYRVSGSSTQVKGVASDVVLPSRWDGLDVFEGGLPNALDWDRIPPAPFVRTSDLSGVLPGLVAQSRARVDASEDFATLEQILADRAELRAQPEVSLVLAERQRAYEERVRRAGGDKDDTPAHGAGAERDDDGPGDIVLDEAISVLDDLVAARSR